MNQTRLTRKTGRWLGAALLAPLVALGACGDDDGPTEVVVEEDERYLDEVFAEITTENDIQYGMALDENGAEEALLLDLHQPSGDTEPLRPAVVWVHGGSFQHGHKAELREYSQRSARSGFVSVSANYRLREAADFDYTDPDDPIGEEAKQDAQHDIQAAVRWLRANAEDLKIDTDQIFLAGYSAGGTAAVRVAANPDDPGSSGNPGPSSSVSGVVAISASVESGMLEAASGPTLLIHGTDDTKVPFSEVDEACSAVAGCELVAVEGAVHHMIETAREQITSEIAQFLYDQVAGA